MSQSQDKEQVNFLTLAREIRQKILYASFEDALEQDIGFNTNHAILHMMLTQKTCDRAVSAHNIACLASALASVNDTISTDLGFVVDKRLNELERAYKTKERDTVQPSTFYVQILNGKGSLSELKPKAVGLHDQRLVRGLKKYRVWGNALFGFGGGLMLPFHAKAMSMEVYSRQRACCKRLGRQNRRKAMLGDMIDSVICSDECHPERYREDMD